FQQKTVSVKNKVFLCLCAALTSFVLQLVALMSIVFSPVPNNVIPADRWPVGLSQTIHKSWTCLCLALVGCAGRFGGMLFSNLGTILIVRYINHGVKDSIL